MYFIYIFWFPNSNNNTPKELFARGMRLTNYPTPLRGEIRVEHSLIPSSSGSMR